ncbi:MAG: ABC transporter ATP-binding protein [Planctomycetaceae bacterium]|nr:ABC transporter ATP-binding protein [Planctomycetaceae bacterium]MCB9950267.1 ABC transporter ATP-binding protein [Planctomycetaceae bacterium]
MTSQLQVKGICKNFETPEGPLEILRGVDLQMSSGDTASIVGPSGSGKSTLLYILGLLDPPSSGEMLINGEAPWGRSPSQQAEFRSRRIGFVFQDHHLLPQCNVLENVLVPTLATGGANAAATERAKSLLERVGLSERLNHRPAQLSGGERQRVAVCRALINQPALVLADEPTGNLDQSTAQTVGTLLLELARESEAILVCVTHSQELAQQFSRVLELRNGKLVESGS